MALLNKQEKFLLLIIFFALLCKVLFYNSIILHLWRYGVMTLGDNLRKLRDSHHWTQVELANISGVSEKYISAIERGERSAGKKTITRLCESFAVTEEVLRYGTQRAKFTRAEVELIAALRRDGEKMEVALELASLPGGKVAFVREAVRLMGRYPER